MRARSRKGRTPAANRIRLAIRGLGEERRDRPAIVRYSAFDRRTERGQSAGKSRAGGGSPAGRPRPKKVRRVVRIDPASATKNYTRKRK